MVVVLLREVDVLLHHGVEVVLAGLELPLDLVVAARVQHVDRLLLAVHQAHQDGRQLALQLQHALDTTAKQEGVSRGQREDGALELQAIGQMVLCVGLSTAPLLAVSLYVCSLCYLGESSGGLEDPSLVAGLDLEVVAEGAVQTKDTTTTARQSKRSMRIDPRGGRTGTRRRRVDPLSSLFLAMLCEVGRRHGLSFPIHVLASMGCVRTWGLGTWSV